MKLFSQKDVDRKALKGARIAVIGYGSQGRAHALINLKDSGFDVVVGVRRGGDGWKSAKKDGLAVAEPATAVVGAELVASKSIWGPFIPYEQNPILTQRDLPADRKDPITSAGHAQFVEGPDGKLYAVFLAVRPYEGDYYNTGRETFIAPVEWKHDWPIINPDSKEIKYAYTANYKEIKQRRLATSRQFSIYLKLQKKPRPYAVIYAQDRQ